MFLIRKIARLLRGHATPTQIVLACLLGSVIGFVPDQRSSLVIGLTLTAVLIILNANLLLATMAFLISELLGLLLAPISFYLGRLILDGPFSEFVSLLVNAPLLAWFGLEYYTTVGGILLGTVLGLSLGIFSTSLLMRIRRRMAELEEHSATYNQLVEKRSVRILAWIFLGGTKDKKLWSRTEPKRMGNPVRPVGVVLVGVSLFLVFLLCLFLDDQILTIALQRRLERWNGASVDIENVSFDLYQNRLRVSGLALADSGNLDTDFLRAENVVADFGGLSLLCGKLALDELEISGASSGKSRSVPGILIERATPSHEQQPTTREGTSLAEVLQGAKIWQERLGQIRGWLERLNEALRPESRAEADTWADRLRNQVELMGYHRVYARHLVREAPLFTVYSASAKGVTFEQITDEVFNFEAKNLSTHPMLLASPPSLTIASASKRFNFGLEGPAKGSETVTFSIAAEVRRIPAASLSGLASGSTAIPIRDGFLDLEGHGIITGVSLDLPLILTLTEAYIKLPKIGEQYFERLVIPVSLRGPFDAPQVKIETADLQRALAKAGKAGLSAFVKRKAADLMDANVDELEEGGKSKAKAFFRSLLEDGSK